MAFTETLSAYFADYSAPATLQGVAVGSGVIFDGDYARELDGRVDGSIPVVTVIDSEVPGVAQGQTLIITPTPRLNVPGGTYKVRGVRPDGTGITLLELEAQ